MRYLSALGSVIGKNFLSSSLSCVGLSGAWGKVIKYVSSKVSKLKIVCKILVIALVLISWL